MKLDIDVFVDVVYKVLERDLREITAELPRTCPHFVKKQERELNNKCSAIPHGGWISGASDMKESCDREFPHCGWYQKEVMKKRLPERFFLAKLKRKCMEQIKDFVISGLDVQLEGSLIDMFMFFQLKKRRVKDKDLEHILSRFHEVVEEVENGKEAPKFEFPKTQHARDNPDSGNNIDTSTSLVS